MINVNEIPMNLKNLFTKRKLFKISYINISMQWIRNGYFCNPLNNSI